MRFLRAFPLMLLCGIALAACASDKEDYVERPVEQLYNTAMDQLYQKDYANASKSFDTVDREHPYSVWATKAQLMSAYALYQASKYDESVVAADRFIQLHPGSRDVAYAYYLKALDYYIQIPDVQRDQKVTQQAWDALAEVVRRFPDSRYARDARFKMDLARDHLAGREMEIGRWYEGRGDYLAAINRFQGVVKTYQTTTHVPEALHRLTECYLALGLGEEAQRTAAVLGYNYPGNKWYGYSYTLVTGKAQTPPAADKDKSWVGRLFASIF